jgi:hypothetical protein
MSTPVLRVCWCLATLVIVAVGASGCGKATSGPVEGTTLASGSLPPCTLDTARAKRSLARLLADIARIRHATTHAQTSVATDQFIHDFDRSGLSLVTESRLVDLAVSAVNGKCADCFQALEPMHPKPSIFMHSCR